MDSIDSTSTYTYKDWEEEYGKTADSALWYPVKLNDKCSMEKFGRTDLYLSLCNEEEQTSNYLQRFSLDRDDIFMEPLLKFPKECLDSILKIMPFESAETIPMPICANTYGYKNIVYTLSNCVLCVSGSRQDVYIPSSLSNKVKVDMSHKEIKCESPKFTRGMAFHKSVMLPNAKKNSMHLYNESKKRKVTQDHAPMYSDEYKQYVMVDATICVMLIPKRRRVDSQYGSDPITFHDKREIRIYVLSLSPQSRLIRNDVAESTSDGDSR